jgi:hypothetical protein
VGGKPRCLIGAWTRGYLFNDYRKQGESEMAVERIDVLCCCEGCGKRFGIELDVGTDLDGTYLDFEEAARDTIRGGTAGYTWGVRAKATVERYPLTYQPTIQADLMLCDVCSRKCDDLPIEEDLTRQQVNQALGIPSETT